MEEKQRSNSGVIGQYFLHPARYLLPLELFGMRRFSTTDRESQKQAKTLDDMSKSQVVGS